MKRYLIALTIMIVSTACDVADNITLDSRPSSITVGDFTVTPQTARPGETLRFAFTVTNSEGYDLRWSLDVQSQVEGTGSIGQTSRRTVTHEETANTLRSRYGAGSKTARLRVYDGRSDQTYSSQTATFTLQ